MLTLVLVSSMLLMVCSVSLTTVGVDDDGNNDTQSLLDSFKIVFDFCMLINKNSHSIGILSHFVQCHL